MLMEFGKNLPGEFFDNVNKVQGLELTKKILENLSLVKDHRALISV